MPATTRNHILQRIGRKELARLAPDLEDVTLSFKQALYEPGDRVDGEFSRALRAA